MATILVLPFGTLVKCYVGKQLRKIQIIWISIDISYMKTLLYRPTILIYHEDSEYTAFYAINVVFIIVI